MSENATNNVATVTVRYEDPSEPESLYCHYSNTPEPQPVRLALDLRDGEMYLEYTPQIGSGVPSEEWHGLVRTIQLPASIIPTAAGANRILDDPQLLEAAQEVLNTAKVYRDNNGNLVGSANTEPLEEVISDLAELADCGQLEIPRVQEYDAAEWFEPAGVENELASLGLELTADTTDEELDALADAIRESAQEQVSSVEDEGDYVVLYGLGDFLESYREELIEEAVEELDDELGQVVTQLDELATRRDDLIRRIYRLGRSSYRDLAKAVGFSLSHETIRRIVQAEDLD